VKVKTLFWRLLFGHKGGNIPEINWSLSEDFVVRDVEIMKSEPTKVLLHGRWKNAGVDDKSRKKTEGFLCFKRRPKPYPTGVHTKSIELDSIDDAMVVFGMVVEHISGKSSLFLK
jgi:hypothetical protein